MAFRTGHVFGTFEKRVTGRSLWAEIYIYDDMMLIHEKYVFELQIEKKCLILANEAK